MWFLSSNQISQPFLNALIGVVFFWLIKYLFSVIKRTLSLPSGPWGLPILGYLTFLKEHVYLQFDELSKKYGPVYCLKLGKYDVAIVCDWPHLKDAAVNDALLARSHETFFPGILDTPAFSEMSGDPWRQHRRLSLHILRDVGLGKNTIETLIKEEIDQFLKALNNGGKPVDFSDKIGPSISNNIAILLFGHKYDYNDPTKIELNNAQDRLSRAFQFAGILAFLPWLSRIFSSLGIMNLKVIKENVLYLDSFVQYEINKHKDKPKDTQEDVDYIDGYLEEMRKREKTNVPDDTFTLEVLRRNATAFFMAGSETVLSTMQWAILYLIKFPEYQDKIRSEIADVIGFEQKPDYSDRTRMPFTMAFLYEVQRIESIIGNNLIRRATRDTKIGNYNIPKDTLVIFNFWSIHHDSKLWPNPDKFDPSRFLNEDGSKAIKPAYLVPFSVGKRNCPGEGLANVEMFLYLVCILQKFKVKVEPGTEISFKASYGISRRPVNMPKFVLEEVRNV